MAYQKKYWFEFTSLDNKVNRVELWQDTVITLTAEEVDSMGMPFSIEMPDLSHKFQVVRGTGCEINLLSATDRKFFDGLYHTQMKEFIVKHYIDSAINWLGYLNSEMVREVYSEAVNYPFQITGNDGFALLDRLQFLSDEGVKYSGVSSIYLLIKIALDRIALPYGSIFISLSTTFAGYSNAVDSSVLHETFVATENFYNEDGIAETMRKVIEGCLQPFGAFITQVGGDIYIVDSHTLATGSGSFKEFDFATNAYVDTATIDLTKDIADIGYMGTGSDIERSGGKNKQVVTYSPYPVKTVFPETLLNESECDPIAPEVTWSTKDPSNQGYATRYLYYKSAANHAVYNVYSPGLLELSYAQNDNGGPSLIGELEEDACINIYTKGSTGASTKILDLKAANEVYISGAVGKSLSDTKTNRGLKIKISGEVYLRANLASNKGIGSLALKCLLRIGSKSLSDTGEFLAATESAWVAYPGTPQTYHYIKINKPNGKDIKHGWVPFEFDGNQHNIEINTSVGGIIYFEIYSDYEFQRFDGTLHRNNADWSNAIRIRKLTLSMTDIDTEEQVGDKDVEFQGYLDKTVKEEAEQISLICGTDTTGIDRGKIMYADSGAYTPITAFTRAGQTQKIEYLLLNSLSSNYRFGYLTINSLKLENKFNQLSVITDTGIISDKKFMVKSMSVNFRDNLVETAITELTVDSLTITPY